MTGTIDPFSVASIRYAITATRSHANMTDGPAMQTPHGGVPTSSHGIASPHERFSRGSSLYINVVASHFSSNGSRE